MRSRSLVRRGSSTWPSTASFLLRGKYGHSVSVDFDSTHKQRCVQPRLACVPNLADVAATGLIHMAASMLLRAIPRAVSQ